MRQQRFLLIAAVLATGMTAFFVGRTVAVMRQSDAAGELPQWLDRATPQAVQSEKVFQEQTDHLAGALQAEQTLLASMLSNMRVTGGQILAQVERVNQSYAILAKSVGAHLADLQSSLPQDQRQVLLQSCGNSLRGSVQRRYRWRGGAQDQGDGFMGGRQGGRRWGGGGRGAGYGRQYRGGRSEGAGSLARRLQLTEEQSTWIQQQDATFEEQCSLLREQLYQVHTDLVASIENGQPPTAEGLMARIDRLIEAHGTLEKRVAEHIVMLRPQLSPEQRDRLSALFTARPTTGDNAASAVGNRMGTRCGRSLSDEPACETIMPYVIMLGRY